MASAQAHSVVLVCEDAPHWFADASRSLVSLHTELGAERLSRFDFFYYPPLRLVCKVRLAGGDAEASLRARFESAVAQGHLRIVEASEAIGQHADAEQLVVCLTDVRDLVPALERLHALVRASEGAARAKAAPETDELPLALHYESGDSFLASYDRRSGLFVESQAQPPVGQRLRLSVTTATGQGPITLSARVVHSGAGSLRFRGRDRWGFGVGFQLTGEQRDLFESFLIALQRGTPWPESSGRCYERFPIRMRVVYHDGNEVHREQTENLSRGGVFINSFDPPALGRHLNLALYAPGHTDPIEVVGEVVRTISAQDAAARGIAPGAGIRFTEAADAVRAKVEQFLAPVETEARRRALIVDDDRFFRTVFSNTLRLAGFDVREAADGDTAYRLFEESAPRPDVLLIDMYMPGMTGVELLDKVRRVAQAKDLAVVVLTGTELSNLDRASLEHLGADDVLYKGVEPELALERVERALARRAFASPSA